MWGAENMISVMEVDKVGVFRWELENFDFFLKLCS
jgi:hypothetical protein